MSIDKATIVNWALTDIGAGPMFSIDDDGDLAMQVAATWDRVVDGTFGKHDWTFCRITAIMNRDAATPENGWKYGYQLPSPRLSNPLAYLPDPARCRDVIRHFTLQQGKMYCNEPSAWAVYKTYVDPDYWDPAFRAAFVIALAGMLAVPVWQDEDMRDRRLAQAFGSPSLQGTGGEIGRLMAQDKASAPIGEHPLLAHDPLSDVRPTGAGDAWYGRW
jgi:hypothetical protein